MKINTIIIAVWLLGLGAGTSVHADDRATIDSLLNRQISLRDGWTGQSLKIIKEDNDYRVIRTFHGSGLPVIGTITYRAELNGVFQIRFSEVVTATGKSSGPAGAETFILTIQENNNLQVLLNGLELTAGLAPSPIR